MSKKKFTIKISEPVKMPADFEEKNWKVAFDAVDIIINKKAATPKAQAEVTQKPDATWKKAELEAFIKKHKVDGAGIIKNKKSATKEQLLKAIHRHLNKKR